MARKPFGMLRSVPITLVVFCVACDGITSPTTDVPCFHAPEWDITDDLRVRTEKPGSRVLLFTSQSQLHTQVDLEDGELDVDFHRSVYKLDPESQTIEMVSFEEWDAAAGNDHECRSIFEHDSPFDETGDKLFFGGRPVAVAGGVVALIRRAPIHEVVAVLSASGKSPSVPFLISGETTGQHYHQIYSEVTGEALGTPIRVLAADFGCWTANDRYVLYTEYDDELTPTTCVVEVTEDLPRLREPFTKDR